MEVQVVDPWVDPEEAVREYGVTVTADIPSEASHGAVVAAVAHRQFVELELGQWQQLLTPSGVLLDLKGIVPRNLGALRL